MLDKITKSKVLEILGDISASTLKRLIEENNFPKPEKIGRQIYFRTSQVHDWVSLMAGCKFSCGDKLFSSRKLEVLFARSPVWVWQKFQKNKQRKAKAIYLRSRPFWVESHVLADPELKKYLDVASKEVA
jgi:predicted DNA-binding transcriptional regulator AlpA